MLSAIMHLFNSHIFNVLFEFYVYNKDFTSELYKIHLEQCEFFKLRAEIKNRIRFPWHLRTARENYVMELLTSSQNSIIFAGLDETFFYFLADAGVSYADVLNYDAEPVQTLIYIFCMNYHAHTHDLFLLKSGYEQYLIYSDRAFTNWAIPIELHTSGIKWRCNYCQFNYQNQFLETFSNERHGGMNQGRQYRHILHDTRTLRVFFYQIIRDKTETFYYV